MTRHEFWVASAAIRAQDAGPNTFEEVDGHAGSQIAGFYRGFSTSFRLKPEKNTWFHIPLPTPSLIGGGNLKLVTVSLLWDAEDDAYFDWATIHHGGATRIELTPRAEEIKGEIETEKEYPHGLKVVMRRSDFDLADPLPISMGLQLCLSGQSGGYAGTLRFYGAGAFFQEA